MHARFAVLGEAIDGIARLPANTAIGTPKPFASELITITLDRHRSRAIAAIRRRHCRRAQPRAGRP